LSQHIATPAAPEEIATRAQVSLEAVNLAFEQDIIDLHIEPFLPHRLYGYDLHQSHGLGLLRGHLMGHLDFPRMREGGLGGAMWSITTNIARTRQGRWEVFLKNVRSLQELMAQTDGGFRLVRTAGEYQDARKAGAHGAMIVVQGGNALEAGIDCLEDIPEQLLTRVTLVHLTNSALGITSSPLRWPKGGEGLSPLGKKMIEALNHHRIFVDLAHINEQGFWDAMDVHPKDIPVLVTHTGVDGVAPHWRNLTDDQMKAVSATGGTIGIIFAKQFLKRAGGPADAHMVLEHMEHVMNVCGDDHVSIGSDLDGFISPPKDLRNGDAYLRLIQGMLERKWCPERIQKVCSTNFLRTFEQLRP